MTAKTWLFAYNTTPMDQSSQLQQSRSFIFQWTISFMVGVLGWSVPQSCDSTQVKNSNTWLSLTNLVWAASGAHSWIVLKSPAGIRAGQDGSYTGDQSCIWLSVDLLNASSNIATFRLHNVAPTGGTTSAAPTSANQISWANQQFARSTFSATANFHFSGCSTGEFSCHVGYTLAGYLPFSFVMPPLVNLEKNTSGVSLATWPNNADYPYGVAAFGAWLDSGRGALQTNSYLGANPGSTIDGFWGAWQGWAYDGSPATVRALTLCTPVLSNSGIGGWASVCRSVSQFFPATGDAINSKQVTSAIHAMCDATGKVAMIGKVADMELSRQGCTIGSTDSLSSPNYVLIGDVWVPTNSAVSL